MKNPSIYIWNIKSIISYFSSCIDLRDGNRDVRLNGEFNASVVSNEEGRTTGLLLLHRATLP